MAGPDDPPAYGGDMKMGEGVNPHPAFLVSG